MRTQQTGGLGVDDEQRFLAALVAGSDSRLRLGPDGLNKYFCPPRPVSALTCLSSCTASTIGEAGFREASATFRCIEGPGRGGVSRHGLYASQAGIAVHLRTWLGLDRDVGVTLAPSGTDGILFAAALLAVENGGVPLPAVLPSPSETGTGVPLAAACRLFDGMRAGDAVFAEGGDVLTVAVRGPDGAARDLDDVAASFTQRVRSVRGRSVVIVTHGTKTGLIAPIVTPSGAEVIVDACQLRLPPVVIRSYLREGWPVVVTGSKFLGGPAFCGAVLLPPDRFPNRSRARARAICARSVPTDRRLDARLGTVLRWTAALAGLRDVSISADDLVRSVRGLEREAVEAVSALPGVQVIELAGSCPGIITFAVRSPGCLSDWLPMKELRPIYARLAAQGVLVGQPVDLGPFGALRVAIGLRDVTRGSVAAGLRALADAWPYAFRAVAAKAA